MPELIQGLVRIWNHTDQGVCVQIPTSSGEAISFSIINLNFTKLQSLKLYCRLYLGQSERST